MTHYQEIMHRPHDFISNALPKNLRKVLFLLAVLFVLSCSQESPDPLPETTEGTLKLKISYTDTSKTSQTILFTRASICLHENQRNILTASTESNEWLRLYLSISTSGGISGGSIVCFDGNDTITSKNTDGGEIFRDKLHLPEDMGTVTGGFDMKRTYFDSVGRRLELNLNADFEKITYYAPFDITYYSYLRALVDITPKHYVRNSLQIDADSSQIVVSGLTNYDTSDSQLGHKISLIINRDITTGQYPLGFLSKNDQLPVFQFNYEDIEQNNIWDQFIGDQSGTLNITKHDADNRVIEGSFHISGTLIDDSNILTEKPTTLSDGEFAIHYEPDSSHCP